MNNSKTSHHHTTTTYAHTKHIHTHQVLSILHKNSRKNGRHTIDACTYEERKLWKADGSAGWDGLTVEDSSEASWWDILWERVMLRTLSNRDTCSGLMDCERLP